MIKIGPTIKLGLTVLAFILVFVFSGIGVFAIPKPVQAQWITIKDLGKFIENILLAIWKFAIYPLLKKIVITAVTKGDWGITKEEIEKWAERDLAFQAANSVFKQITGVDLCFPLNATLKLSISKFVQNDKITCTYDRSELVTLLNMDPDKRSAELRKKLYNSLQLSMSGSNNQMFLALDATTSALNKKNAKSTSVKQELTNGFGLLSTRDCSVQGSRSVWRAKGKKEHEIDANGDNYVDAKYRPEYCRKTGIDGQLAETIKKNGGAAGDEFGQTLKSQVLLDLIAVGKMAISSAVEEHAVKPLQKWLKEKLLGTDETAAPNISRSGENQLIEYPTESFIPDSGNNYPDLELQTP